MPEPSLKETVLEAMQRDPRHWRAYYTDPRAQAFRPAVQPERPDPLLLDTRRRWRRPARALLERLAPQRALPLTLLSQYLPLQYAAIRDGRLSNEPRELVLDGVAQVLAPYAQACSPAATHDRYATA